MVDIPSQAAVLSRLSLPEESEENRLVFSVVKPAGLVPRNAVSISCLNSSALPFLVQHSLCTS